MKTAREVCLLAAAAFTNLPEGQHYEISSIGGMKLQASTNEQARALRALFENVTWERKYVDGNCKWWEWHAFWNGIRVEIYAIRETPRDCKMITETRKVIKDVPVAFEQREVEEVVFVGWDCGE